MRNSLEKNKKSKESKVPTLSDFKVEEARKSLIDMTKISLQMTEFIYESETPISESEKPFTSVYRDMKDEIHLMMTKDEKFKDNVVFLLRSEMTPNLVSTKKNKKEPSNETPSKSGSTLSTNKNSSSFQPVLPEEKKSDKIKLNTDYSKASKLMKAWYKELRNPGESFAKFKEKWQEAARNNQDPRLVFRKKRRNPNKNHKKMCKGRGYNCFNRGSYKHNSGSYQHESGTYQHESGSCQNLNYYR